MLFIRDDIGHDDIMGFDGHVRDELDIPGRGNGGRPALSSQEAVIISRSMAQAMALGIEGQAGLDVIFVPEIGRASCRERV